MRSGATTSVCSGISVVVALVVSACGARTELSVSTRLRVADGATEDVVAEAGAFDATALQR